MLHKPWIKTKRNEKRSNQINRVINTFLLCQWNVYCEWKFHIASTQFTRDILRVLTMNLSFVCCARDLILDENLCDYHLKFMLCRRQLAAIHCWRLMEKFQTLAHTQRKKRMPKYTLCLFDIPSNRTKSWAPLKIRRVAHKRFGTKSFFFGFCVMKWPTFSLTFLCNVPFLCFL